MAWCMNTRCGKQGLRKEDVEFDDDLRMVLCQGCYALRHPGWVPPVDVVVQPPVAVLQVPEKFSYEAHLTTENGFSARIGYGEVSLGVHISKSQFQRWLGPKSPEVP